MIKRVLFLFVNIFIGFGLTLKCKICAINQSGYHLDMDDNQRMSFESHKPYCRRFDTVICDRNQDVCLTFVQTMESISKNSPKYMILKGCSYKWKYPTMGTMGCVHRKESVRKTPMNDVKKKPSSQTQMTETCLCDYDSCNKSLRMKFASSSWILYFFINITITRHLFSFVELN